MAQNSFLVYEFKGDVHVLDAAVDQNLLKTVAICTGTCGLMGLLTSIFQSLWIFLARVTLESNQGAVLSVNDRLLYGDVGLCSCASSFHRSILQHCRECSDRSSICLLRIVMSH